MAGTLARSFDHHQRQCGNACLKCQTRPSFERCAVVVVVCQNAQTQRNKCTCSCSPDTPPHEFNHHIRVMCAKLQQVQRVQHTITLTPVWMTRRVCVRFVCVTRREARFEAAPASLSNRLKFVLHRYMDVYRWVLMCARVCVSANVHERILCGRFRLALAMTSSGS